MKIKMRETTYEAVMAKPLPKHIQPRRQSPFLRKLIYTFSKSDLKKVGFEYKKIGMDNLKDGEPALYLMNHSCFMDLEISSQIIYPRPYNIVCTSDGFVGKSKLMRMIGCVPTHKFVMDMALVKDLKYVVSELQSSILMYPEASYSFDGTATPLPGSIGKLIKMLGIPVVMIRTYGAFQRDPLYNNLQVRDVKISADVTYLLSKEDIVTMEAEEINAVVNERFSFDNFRWQQENHIEIDEDFRADFLNRVLYKCPACKAEGKTVGKGTILTCQACNKVYELTTDGFMKALDGTTEFQHIPDWYQWERQEVRRELEEGTYRMEVPVKIGILMDETAVNFVGEGLLIHDINGFHLTGCGGKLNYHQKPSASYSLYSDYFWYEIGDMICVGNMKYLYYCFPADGMNVAAKARLATEELYKINTQK